MDISSSMIVQRDEKEMMHLGWFQRLEPHRKAWLRDEQKPSASATAAVLLNVCAPRYPQKELFLCVVTRSQEMVGSQIEATW